MKTLKDAFKYIPDRFVYGLTKELRTLYIVNYFAERDENVLVLTSTLYEANNLYKSLQTYNGDVLFFPMDDFLPSVALAISPDLKIKRLETLEKLQTEKKKHLVVTSLMGYLKYLPNKNENNSLIVAPDKKIISREIILKKLDEFGYKREELVTTTGEYAVRGFIIDIFPVDREKPVRLEFFGDDVESIKEFDENDQLTTKSLTEVEIKRFNEEVTTNANSLMDYLGNESMFFIDEALIDTAYKNLQEEILEYNRSKELPGNTKYMFARDEIAVKLTYKIETLNDIERQDSLNYVSKDIENFGGDQSTLKTFCAKNITSHTIVFVLETNKQQEEIKDLFADAVLTNKENIIEYKINIVKGRINNGFIFEKYIVIAPNDIDRSVKPEIKYKNTIKIGKKVKTFTELELGDFIVHEQHGIGIYRGLKTIKNGEYIRDYIELEYANKDKVYLPVDKINRLYKYSSNMGRVPKLNKLNSTAWSKKKSETRKKIKDISGELIKLYSSRQKALGVAYKDFDEELAFALNFPFTLTSDQEKTIKEIDLDLKSTAPMDRLLCGDVGYGKTEVAFRAMFKTVLNGFQVSYLCPTTILSKQQYTNAIERFKDFPVRIELLNRHIPSKKVKTILEDLAAGKVDIVIGTHKLLNEKIEYKNLGLLVIDEEQRFGVTHKEKIKKLKTDINVLTLSATPIPRTLKMAMSGLRSLSVLDTAPINRYPIQTYVIEENDLIIKDAIYKELTRNGQIFVLINNIEELYAVEKRIAKLIPEAKIVCGHGQMSAEELNSIMEEFVEGKYDVLLCTTIIETGIDIPNVNTIIVLNADHFGLSQLYQIRGRVGRSDKIAYAYLMYNPARMLTETAIKRLESIKEFTELGSGYKIAMRDLAIRGAGDLLGSEQAGFIDAIGLDLYTKMINEEVSKLEGNYVEEETADDNVVFNTNTHIADSFVQDESIKIEIHKMINAIKNKNDFIECKREIEDRFGKIDDDLEIYMIEKCTEGLIASLGIKNIIQLQNRVTIVLPEDISNSLDGEKLFLQSYNICPKFEFSYKSKEIRISLNKNLLKKNYIYYIYELLDTINNQIKEV